jgi:hypothetical protein
MSIDFENISYLKGGTTRQKQAYQALTKHQLLLKPEGFQPILVGTIPLNINIENSDLDIICCFNDAHSFQKEIMTNFRNEKSFTIREQLILDRLAIVANFFIDDF